MTGRLIELEIGEPWDPATVAAAHASRRWFLPRWLLLGMLTVFALAALPASAPQRWDPVLARRFPDASVVFGPDIAYLAAQGATGGRIEAYRPGRDAPLWTVTDTAASLLPIVVDDPDLLLVDRFQPQPAEGGLFATSTQARNARTGALLWERSDWSVMDVTSELVILVRQDSPDGIPAGTAERPTDVVEAVDRRTGTPRWSSSAGAGVVWAVDVDDRPDGDRQLVELQPDGLLRISDAATNAVRRTFRLPLAGRPFRVTTHDGLAVVQQFRPGQGNGRPDLVVAYDLATGAEGWRHDDADFPVLCGDHYFCEYGTSNSWVIDPATDAVAYRRPGSRFTLHGDRLLLWQRGRATASDGGAALVDLRTGRTVRAFGGWRVVADAPERGFLVAQVGLTGPITIGVLDPDHGTVAVLGQGPRWLGDPDCAWGPAYIGCAGPDGVQIWRLPQQSRAPA